MFTHKAYFIETLTNTHVGSGDTEYGIADNLIQKDPVSSLPVIHSSSLKGAIRDHFEPMVSDANALPAEDKKIKPFTFNAVFGGKEPEAIDDLKKDIAGSPLPELDKQSLSDAAELLRKAPQHGLIKFYEARLLTVPLRSSVRVCFHATSAFAVLDYLNSMKDFKAGLPETLSPGIDILISFFEQIRNTIETIGSKEFMVFSTSDVLPVIEDFDCGLIQRAPADGQTVSADGFWKGFRYNDIKKYIGAFLTPNPSNAFIESLAVFKDDIFSDICRESLPIIARNSLDEKGISENLFYEEILPRRSVLWFMTGTYSLIEEKTYAKPFEFFEKQLVSDLFQIGANASVGYGVCRFHRIGGGR